MSRFLTRSSQFSGGLSFPFPNLEFSAGPGKMPWGVQLGAFILGCRYAIEEDRLEVGGSKVSGVVFPSTSGTKLVTGRWPYEHSEKNSTAYAGRILSASYLPSPPCSS